MHLVYKIINAIEQKLWTQENKCYIDMQGGYTHVNNSYMMLTHRMYHYILLQQLQRTVTIIESEPAI